MLCIKTLFNYLNLTEPKGAIKRWPYHTMTSETILRECHRLVLCQTGVNEMVDEPAAASQICISYVGLGSLREHFIVKDDVTPRSLDLNHRTQAASYPHWAVPTPLEFQIIR